MGMRGALQQNSAVTQLGKILYSSAITIAGLVACWVGSMFVSAVEALAVSQFFPGAWGEGGPTKVAAKLALRLAGCVGLMAGGYVSAWLASRAQRSELKHAFLVGCIYGVLGVLSDSQPISWMLASFIFLIAVSAATLGGWLREAQVRKYRTTVAVPRFR
jgi:hypothetical protein